MTSGDGGLDEGVLLGYSSGRAHAAETKLGRMARVRSGTVVYCGTVIGERFQTGHNVVVREDCVIGDDVSIWSSSLIDYGCRIGDRVKIHAGCYIAQFSEIDDDAFLAPGVVLANDLYPGSSHSAAAMRGPTIGCGAQIGANVTLLPYVSIGHHALIGAGAVVTKDIPPGVVAYGCPATAVRDVDDEDRVRDRLNERLRTRHNGAA